MKRHSILSTLFPRLVFSRQSLAKCACDREVSLSWRDGQDGERFHHLRPWLGNLRSRKSETAESLSVVVSDWLPSFEVPSDRGTTSVRTHLEFIETDANDRLLNITNNPATAVVYYGARGPSGEVTLATKEQETEESATLVAFWDLLTNHDVGTIDFILQIRVLDEASIKGERQIPDSVVAAERKEFVASELTTGYRRLIGCLLQLISCAAREQHRINGTYLLPELSCDFHDVKVVHNSYTDGMHSTPEDAWRLLCSFHSIEIAAKHANKRADPAGNHVLGIDDFVRGLTALASASRPSTAQEILENLYKEKGIKKVIGLRKSFEYYLYEEITSLPH